MSSDSTVDTERQTLIALCIGAGFGTPGAAEAAMHREVIDAQVRILAPLVAQPLDRNPLDLEPFRPGVVFKFDDILAEIVGMDLTESNYRQGWPERRLRELSMRVIAERCPASETRPPAWATPLQPNWRSPVLINGWELYSAEVGLLGYSSTDIRLDFRRATQ